MKTKGKAWKLKNKGFTLIEMIVTVAIIAIFSGVVVTFIGTGSGVYRNTSSNSKVQMETQETFDKIEDLIIDANRSLYYANGSGSNIGAEIKNDIKEKGGTNSTGNKTFISCNEYENSDGTSQYIYDVLDWQSSDGKIYYSRREYTAQSSNDNSENENQDDNDVQSFSDESGENAVSDDSDAPVKVKNAKTLVERSVLASGILDFRADVSKVESDKIVRFQLTTESGNKQIQTLHSVSLRNNVDLKKPADAFNNAEATDVGIKIINARESMDPGESMMLAYGLTGNGSIDPTTVTWTVVEYTDNGSFPTQDHTNGRLTISDSASGYITVQVSAVSTTGQLVKSQIVTIKINAKAIPSPTPTPMPKELSFKPNSLVLGAGQDYTLNDIITPDMTYVIYDDGSMKKGDCTLRWNSSSSFVTINGNILTISSDAGKNPSSGNANITAVDSKTGVKGSIEIIVARIDIEKPKGEYEIGDKKEFTYVYSEGGVAVDTGNSVDVGNKYQLDIEAPKKAGKFKEGDKYVENDIGAWKMKISCNIQNPPNKYGTVFSETEFSVNNIKKGEIILNLEGNNTDCDYLVAGQAYECSPTVKWGFNFFPQELGDDFWTNSELKWSLKQENYTGVSIRETNPSDRKSEVTIEKARKNATENFIPSGFVLCADYIKYTDAVNKIAQVQYHAEKEVDVVYGIELVDSGGDLVYNGEEYTVGKIRMLISRPDGSTYTKMITNNNFEYNEIKCKAEDETGIGGWMNIKGDGEIIYHMQNTAPDTVVNLGVGIYGIPGVFWAKRDKEHRLEAYISTTVKSPKTIKLYNADTEEEITHFEKNTRMCFQFSVRYEGRDADYTIIWDQIQGNKDNVQKISNALIYNSTENENQLSCEGRIEITTTSGQKVSKRFNFKLNDKFEYWIEE